MPPIKRGASKRPVNLSVDGLANKILFLLGPEKVQSLAVLELM